MKNRYASFFGAFNDSVKRGNPNTKEEQVKEFTKGRTDSLKDLTDWELQELTRLLRIVAPQPIVDDKSDRMRKAIIAIFKSMNRQTADAINWAEKQGVRGVKKPFNDYTTGDLFVLINIAEKVKMDWQKSIRKKIAG